MGFRDSSDVPLISCAIPGGLLPVRDVLNSSSDLAEWCFVNDILIPSRAQLEPTADGLTRPGADRMRGPQVEVIDSLSGYTVRGVLDDFTHGEVRIRIGEVLPEQRPVTVRILGFVFFGDVVYCRLKGSDYEAHITIDDFDSNGLRKEPRLPVRIPGHLWTANAAPKPIVLRDISGQGLRIESTVAVSVGEPLIVTTSRALIFGTVRYCRRTGEKEFRAGIEMHHVLERSSPKLTAASRVLSKHAAEPGIFRNGLKRLSKLLHWRCDHCGA